jgi:hypothetical protein
MQYKVIVIGSAFSTKRALEKLAKEVNDAIAEGWEPLGGVTFAQTSMLQAMIKRR